VDRRFLGGDRCGAEEGDGEEEDRFVERHSDSW
jgi:hypothetical protein